MEIAALILSTFALALSLWAIVEIQASKRSTHRITQLPVVQQETQVTTDLPQHIMDQLPSPPEKMTATEYLKWQAQQQAEDDFFNE